MDDGLWEAGNIHYLHQTLFVLILVVMDDGLWDGFVSLGTNIYMTSYPCCNGWWSHRDGSKIVGANIYADVLILVVMDDGLWEHNSKMAIVEYGLSLVVMDDGLSDLSSESKRL
jgi:hypothetical protein